MQISIASGKGGTGKTTVAVNLAAAAARRSASPSGDTGIQDAVAGRRSAGQPGDTGIHDAAAGRRSAGRPGDTGVQDAVAGRHSDDPSGDTRIQLLDCDVEEPNCHIYLRPELTRSMDVEIPVPQVDESRCTRCGLCGEVCAFHAILPGKRVLTFPELCHGCGACEYLCPERCITEVPRKIGVMQTGTARLAGSRRYIDFVHGVLNTGEAPAAPLAKRVRREADPNRLVIIDSPPGTSCTIMASVKESDLCLLVTEPTPFGLHDLEPAYQAVKKLGVPSAVIVNRAGIGDDRVTRFCEANEIPLLAELPLDKEMARISAVGQIAAEVLPRYESLFSGILDRAFRMASEKTETQAQRKEGPK